jgi:hypothetical protein
LINKFGYLFDENKTKKLKLKLYNEEKNNQASTVIRLNPYTKERLRFFQNKDEEYQFLKDFFPDITKNDPKLK